MQAVELEVSGTKGILPSPKSPLLLKKRSDNNRKCTYLSLLISESVVRFFFPLLIVLMDAVNRENKDGKFSIGQSLRIRVGPLKGYLCCVMGIQDSNVTVKLDSQHKIITGWMVMLVYFWFFVKCRCTDVTFCYVISVVKGEDLSDVRGRNSAISKRY